MPASVVKGLAKQSGKSEAEVEKLWDKAKGLAKKEYPDVEPDSDRYFKIITGILKNMVGISEGEENMDESTTTGDIAVNPQKLGDMQSRFKYDKEHYGMPCFIVSEEDYRALSVAHRSGGRYNVQDERVRNFMQETQYRKPFCAECNDQMVKIDYRNNKFRR